MRTRKPKVKRSYVTVTDPDTRKSLHITVYDASPKDVVAQLKRKPTPVAADPAS